MVANPRLSFINFALGLSGKNLKLNMKKLFVKSVLVLAMSVTFFSCSSDSDSSTPTPVPCPQGYTGTNCNIPITPTKIKITKFKVTNFPNVEDNGTNWDLSPNIVYPDIYLQFDSYVMNGTIYNDVLSTGTNSFNFILSTPIEITTVNNLHTVYLGDWDLNDSPSNSNDLMAQIDFYPYQSINGFPSTLTLIENNTSSAFKVELTLTYEW